jgi:hypothetical protein
MRRCAPVKWQHMVKAHVSTTSDRHFGDAPHMRHTLCVVAWGRVNFDREPDTWCPFCGRSAGALARMCGHECVPHGEGAAFCW